jgi:hypothetical protein
MLNCLLALVTLFRNRSISPPLIGAVDTDDSSSAGRSTAEPNSGSNIDDRTESRTESTLSSPSISDRSVEQRQ